MTAPMPPADVWRDGSRVSRGRLVFDGATAAVFAALAGLAQATSSLTTVWVALVLAVGLAVRHLSVPVLLVAGVAAGLIQVLTGEIAVFADVAYAPLAFALGLHRSAAVRRTGLVCVLVAVVVAGVSTAVEGNDQFGPNLSSGLGLGALTTVVLGGGWVAGFVRRQQRQTVQARVDAALGAAEQARLEGLVRHEQERSRIAADMHDVVAHSWAVVAAQADGARYVLHDDPARAEEALRVIGETARTAMTDVRGLLAELRDEAAAPLEVPTADGVVDRMRRTGLQVEHARHGTPRGGPVAEAAGYVLTESLTNALKHGDHARPVDVVEDWRDGFALRVANEVPAGAAPGSGHGLRGMAERVAATGGVLRAGAEGRSWIVEVRIPAEVGG